MVVRHKKNVLVNNSKVVAYIKVVNGWLVDHSQTNGIGALEHGKPTEILLMFAQVEVLERCWNSR